MRNFTFWLLNLLFWSPYAANAQDSFILKGQVKDAATHNPVPYATIAQKGSLMGINADVNGYFLIKLKQKPPVVLQISSVGYNLEEQEIKTTGFKEILLAPKSRQTEEVVITASRLVEKSVESPVTIEQLEAAALKLTPAPTFFDALEGVKGVQMTTASLGFKVPNTRGFTNPTNVRFLQLVDGIDNQAPVIGASIANAAGPSELDIERVEIIPGTASALYGMNSLNGLANFFTKSAWDYKGVSFYQRTGINHLNNSETSPHLITESNMRVAQVFQNKWAVKINLSYLRGYDWIAHQTEDLNSMANASVNLLGSVNPASDPVNSYGNESPNRRTLTVNSKNYIIARTGYYEKDITDYQLENLKADFALHHRFSPVLEAYYSFRIGKIDNVYQRTNRFKLHNYLVNQQVFGLKHSDWQWRAYLTRETSGHSYNIRSLAENLDRSFKNDNTWFTDYRNSLQNSLQQGITVEEAHQRARSVADAGRFETGTSRYDSVVNQLISINNWDRGAALRTKASLFHTEGQYDLSRYVKLFQVLVGGDFRFYSVFPDGNYFINPTEAGKNILYHKGGGFLQITKKFLEDKLLLNGAMRYDKNEYFKGFFNPRLAMVYTWKQNHNFRMSFQNGYRFPSIFEAFSNVNSGGVKRVGGLPVMSSGIFEDSYIRTSIDAFSAVVNRQVNQQGISLKEAITQNAGLLKKSGYDYIKPERINSWEVGYKSINLQNRLFVDIDFYFNAYKHFIAQVEVNQLVKRSVPVDSLPFYLYDRNKQLRYRLWTNSTSTVYNYGSSLGLKYKFYKSFIFAGNTSLAKLHRKAYNDGLEEAFNTPKWLTNVSINNATLTPNIGFQVTWHWQDKFLWQSSLGTGNVPGYHTVDAQISHKIPPAKLLIKVGGTNILNHYYYQMVAGPSVGGLYYITFVFDELINNKP